MTPATLQALRRLLFFSVEEAAALIGGVSPRSWQYWERGERPIPADVIEVMHRLTAWRGSALAAARESMTAIQARHGPPESVRLVWYQTADDFATVAGFDPLLWRPHCSVVAELAATTSAELVTFDAPAYAAWLGKRKDSEALRGAWAAQVTP